MRQLLYTAMARKLSRTRPIITLTTDFRLADSYVAEMKTAILKNCQDALLIDITHLFRRHENLKLKIGDEVVLK